MGARFFEGTMPKIAEQLERLNDSLEALILEVQKRCADRDSACPLHTTGAPKRS
jgi:hypothetical protein